MGRVRPAGVCLRGFFMSMRIPAMGHVEGTRASTTDVSGAEDRAMREAIRLARRGIGTTHPNPRVGAVVLRGSEIVGRGFHARPFDMAHGWNPHAHEKTPQADTR